MTTWTVVLLVVLVLAVAVVVTLLVMRNRRRTKPAAMGLPDLGALTTEGADQKVAKPESPNSSDQTADPSSESARSHGN